MVDLSKHVRAVLDGEPIPPLVVDGPVVIEVRKLAAPRVLTAEEAEAVFRPRSVEVLVIDVRGAQLSDEILARRGRMTGAGDPTKSPPPS